MKALVGGTLIDGYGGAPIRNSAVRGDVLRYITLLQHVDIVVKRGSRVK